MDYSKILCFCYLLSFVILTMLIQEQSCGRTPTRGNIARSCPKLTLANGLVKPRSKGRIAKYSCNYGFELVGAKTATCVRGRWEGETPLCAKPGCMKAYPPKNGQSTEIYAGAVLMFFCNNGYRLNGSRSIYCNGVGWNGTVPACQVDNTEPDLSCDFENEELCGWTQDTHHNFDWRRQNFATPSGHVGTGPSFDHTKGKGLDGHYMYIESSSPRMVNDTARLFSPVFPADTSRDACFIFWYHMYGATTGSLNVYVKSEEDVDLTGLKPLFSKSGDQGNQWFRGLVRLQETKIPYQIIVEGVRGAGYVSDSAIDDVQLTNGTDCLEPVIDTSESTVTKVETGGGGEVFDDAQSCRTRCSGNPASSESNTQTSLVDGVAPETPVMVLCDCDVGCLDNGTCCPDYSSYCILAKVTLSPAGPRLEYRTIASVHYFPLTRTPPASPPPPPVAVTTLEKGTTLQNVPVIRTPPPYPPLPPVATTLGKGTTLQHFPVTPPPYPSYRPIPPPLPPLPPKPTSSMTSPEHPNPIQTITNSAQQITKYPPITEIPYVDFTESTQYQEILTDQVTAMPAINDTVMTMDTRTTQLTNDVSLSTFAILVNPEISEYVTMPDLASKLPPQVTESTEMTVDLKTTPLMPSLLSSTKKNSVVISGPTTVPPPKLPETDTNKTQNSNLSTVFVRPLTTSKVPFTQPTVSQKVTTTTRRPRTKLTTKSKPKYPGFPWRYPATTTTTARPTMKPTKPRIVYNPNLTVPKTNEDRRTYLLRKELGDQPKGNSGKLWQLPHLAPKDSGSNVSMIVGLVGGLALIVLAFGVLSFAYVRRRRLSTGRRGNLSDDSDVRFLTADEVLDFNLAKPAEESDL